MRHTPLHPAGKPAPGPGGDPLREVGARSPADAPIDGGDAAGSTGGREAQPRGAGVLFQSFWWGGALTPYELSCLRSFVAHGHRYDLYTYDDRLEVPAGVDLRDAATVMPADRVFLYETEPNRGSPSAFANLFRYRLLAERGGWWVDTDVVCLSASVPARDEFYAWSEPGLVNSAILRFPAGSPTMTRCHEAAERAGRAVRWGDTGPRLLTRVLAEARLLGGAAGFDVGEPIPPSMALAPLKPSRRQICERLSQHSRFVHLWSSSLANNGVDKSLAPPRDSYLRRLFDRHPVEGWRGEYVAPVQLRYDTLV